MKQAQAIVQWQGSAHPRKNKCVECASASLSVCLHVCVCVCVPMPSEKAKEQNAKKHHVCTNHCKTLKLLKCSPLSAVLDTAEVQARQFAAR